MSPELVKVLGQRNELRAQLDLVRPALVGMIGGDGTDYLDAVERDLLDGPAPSEKSRGELLEAIRALRETLPALALRSRGQRSVQVEATGNCVICGEPITEYCSYGVGRGKGYGIGNRYHWHCVRAEAETVSPPRENFGGTIMPTGEGKPSGADGPIPLALPGGSAFSQAAAGMESGFDAVPAAPGEEVRP